MNPTVMNPSDVLSRQGRRLLQLGVALFLFTSFEGFVVSALAVPNLADARLIVDTTPYGRQQEFEDSPPGWPQHPTYG